MATLTKQEILTALSEGKKVCHRYFSNDEWIMMDKAGMYEFEDGNICYPDMFWNDRKSAEWQDGWQILD